MRKSKGFILRSIYMAWIYYSHKYTCYLLRATVIIGTPTMFIDLIQKQKELNLNMDSLRFAIIGGAISTPQLIQDITATLKPKCIRVCVIVYSYIVQIFNL